MSSPSNDPIARVASFVSMCLGSAAIERGLDGPYQLDRSLVAFSIMAHGASDQLTIGDCLDFVGATARLKGPADSNAEVPDQSSYVELEAACCHLREASNELIDALQQIVTSWTITRNLDPAAENADHLIRGINMGARMLEADLLLKRARAAQQIPQPVRP